MTKSVCLVSTRFLTSKTVRMTPINTPTAAIIAEIDGMSSIWITYTTTLAKISIKDYIVDREE